MGVVKPLVRIGGDPVAGSQVFAGFSPADESNSTRTNIGAYADLESNLKPQLLANVAGRFENYSVFGSLVTGKLALRYQPQARVIFRAAVSNGFRAPGLGQIHFSKIVTNVIGGTPEQVGVFPVDHPVSRLLGAKPLKEDGAIILFVRGISAIGVRGKVDHVLVNLGGFIIASQDIKQEALVISGFE